MYVISTDVFVCLYTLLVGEKEECYIIDANNLGFFLRQVAILAVYLVPLHSKNESNKAMDKHILPSSKIHHYADIPIPDFVDMIMKGDDEAMYYLLHNQLNIRHRLLPRQPHRNVAAVAPCRRTATCRCLPVDSLRTSSILSPWPFYLSPFPPFFT